MVELQTAYFEQVRPNSGRGRIKLALFDFDGTISLLRAGWQEVMIEFMTELIPRLDGERSDAPREIATELVHRTNGQATLAQMRQLAELIAARGHTPLPIGRYKQLFLERLLRRVRPRLDEIDSGRVPRERWQVPGARLLLRSLCERGVPCYVTSGTDQTAVRIEIERLGLAHYMAGVFGATEDAANSNKAAVFRRLITGTGLNEGEFAVFGDGSEEMRLAREMGGIGFGLAHNGRDLPALDTEQRERLIAAGADVIVVDFRPTEQILHYLFS